MKQKRVTVSVVEPTHAMISGLSKELGLPIAEVVRLSALLLLEATEVIRNGGAASTSLAELLARNADLAALLSKVLRESEKGRGERR